MRDIQNVLIDFNMHRCNFFCKKRVFLCIILKISSRFIFIKQHFTNMNHFINN